MAFFKKFVHDRRSKNNASSRYDKEWSEKLRNRQNSGTNFTPKSASFLRSKLDAQHAVCNMTDVEFLESGRLHYCPHDGSYLES